MSDMQRSVASEEGVPELEVTYSDDPRVVKEAQTEDYSLHAVPKTWRVSRASLLMAWSALFTSAFNLIVAGTITLAVGAANAIIGMVLATVETDRDPSRSQAPICAACATTSPEFYGAASSESKRLATAAGTSEGPSSGSKVEA